MPAVVATGIAAVTGLSATSTGVIIASNIALYAATTAASYFIQQAMAPKQESGTKLKSVLGGAVNQSVVFGRKETAGSFLYKNSWGVEGKTPNAYLVKVYCLSDVPANGFASRLWAGGRQCTIDTGVTATRNGWNVGHPVDEFRVGGEDHLWVKILDGSQTSADNYLRGAFGSDADWPWTAEMIGRGRVLAIVTQKLNKEKPENNNEVDCTFVLEGAKFFDWRDGAQSYGSYSSHTFTANPVVVIYNIMRGIRYAGAWMYGGQQWPAARFDEDTWTAAANTCDENVSLAGGGTQKRYRCGGEFLLSEEPWTVIERLLAACNGRIVESGGVFKIYVGGNGASVLSFTDEDVIISETLTGKLFPTREDIANTIVGSYIEPENAGEAKAYKARTKASYVTEDGGEVRTRQLSFDYVRENQQAQRLALHALNDNRRFLTRLVALGPWARKLEPCDVVSWTSARFGYTSKKFIVGDVTLRDDGIVLVALREVDASDADWTAGDEDIFETGKNGTKPPLSQTVPITVTAITIKDRFGRDRKPAIKFTWSDDSEQVDFARMSWQLRLLDATDIIANGSTEFSHERKVISEGIVRNELYQLRAKAVTESGRPTEWTSWATVETFDLGDVEASDDPPPDLTKAPVVELVTRVNRDGAIRQRLKVQLNGTEPARPSRERYIIRVVDTTESPALSTRYSTDEFPFSFAVQSEHDYTVRILPVSRYGTVGGVSPDTDISVGKKGDAPARPTALTVEATVKALILSWPRPPEPDYSHTNIYRSAVNDFASASKVHEKKGTGWTNSGLPTEATRYYWITHEDRSGNEGPKFPASNTGGIGATTVKVTEDEIDGNQPATPTGLSASQRLDLDGDGHTVLRIRASWDALANDRVSYLLRVMDGDDTVEIPAKKNAIAFAGVYGRTYTLSIAAVSGQGVLGNYSSNVVVVGLKKSATPTRPADLTAFGGYKQVALAWQKSPDADFKRTNIYRSDVNDFSTASIVGRTAGTEFIDAITANAATRYYWITHEDQSGNESGTRPTNPTNGVSATTVRIDEVDTDRTAPGVPGSVTLTQLARDVDADGTVDIAFKVTWTSVAGARKYEVKITQGGDVQSAIVRTRSYIVKAKVGKTYTVEVAAISFNDVASDYSSPETINPNKKSASPSNATGLSATSNADGNAKHRKIVLSWDECTDPDYKWTQIRRATSNAFGDGSNIHTIAGTSWTDGNLGNDVSRWYWVRHIDRSGNAGNWTNAARGDTAQLGRGDVKDGEIIRQHIDTFAVNSPKIAPFAVTQRVSKTVKANAGVSRGGAVTADLWKKQKMKVKNPLPSPITISTDLTVTFSYGGSNYRPSGTVTLTITASGGAVFETGKIKFKKQNESHKVQKTFSLPGSKKGVNYVDIKGRFTFTYNGQPVTGAGGFFSVTGTITALNLIK